MPGIELPRSARKSQHRRGGCARSPQPAWMLDLWRRSRHSDAAPLAKHGAESTGSRRQPFRGQSFWPSHSEGSELVRPPRGRPAVLRAHSLRLCRPGAAAAGRDGGAWAERLRLLLRAAGAPVLQGGERAASRICSTGASSPPSTRSPSFFGSSRPFSFAGGSACRSPRPASPAWAESGPTRAIWASRC